MYIHAPTKRMVPFELKKKYSVRLDLNAQQWSDFLQPTP
jgi:hypothetical protein